MFQTKRPAATTANTTTFITPPSSTPTETMGNSGTPARNVAPPKSRTSGFEADQTMTTSSNPTAHKYKAALLTSWPVRREPVSAKTNAGQAIRNGIEIICGAAEPSLYDSA